MRKATLVFLALFIFLSTVSLQPSFKTFASDYHESWAKDIIEDFILRGIISPDQNGNVEPTKKMTRAEMAMCINKAFGFTKVAEINYADVAETDSFYHDLQIAKGTGYMIGGGDGYPFRPNYPITRQEMSIIVARILELQFNIEPAKKFLDFDEMPTDEAKGAIGAMADSSVKVLEGIGGGLFAPNADITRDQAYTMIYRAEKIYLELQSGKRQYASLTISEKGTYGAQAVTKNYHDVEIYSEGVILENLIIWGDLTIRSSIDSGSVKLNNVIVKGTTYVYGGGLNPNGISINDSELNIVTINKTDNLVQFAFSGASSVNQIIMYSGALIDAPSMTIPKIEISPVPNSKDANIRIAAMLVENISVLSCANITVADSIVQEMTIERNAYESVVSVSSGASVLSATVDAPVVIKGDGTVIDVRVSVDGSVISTPYTKITDLLGNTVENNFYGVAQYYPSNGINNNANNDSNYSAEYWNNYWNNYYSTNPTSNSNNNNTTTTIPTPTTATTTATTNTTTTENIFDNSTKVTNPTTQKTQETQEKIQVTGANPVTVINQSTIEITMSNYGLSANNFLLIGNNSEIQVKAASYIPESGNSFGRYSITLEKEMEKNIWYILNIIKDGVKIEIDVSIN